MAMIVLDLNKLKPSATIASNSLSNKDPIGNLKKKKKTAEDQINAKNTFKKGNST